MIRQILREPLFHFAVIGVVLFGVSMSFDTTGTDERGRIVVGAGQVRNLGETFKLKWLRPPTAKELDGLVEAHVKQEIYYREARSLGLDKNDTVVRRRMHQKVEFLLQDHLANMQPTAAELTAYLEKNAAKYRTEPRTSFSHIYLSASRHGKALRPDALRLLADLKAGSKPVDAAVLSDPFLLPLTFEKTREGDVRRTFGSTFTAALRAVEPGAWAGPLQSGYGLHLVFVRERVAGRLPALTEVHAAVERDWRSVQRRKAAEAFYEQLRERYTIVIERPSGGDKSGAATAGAHR